MAVWTEVTGKVRLRKSSGFSFKTYIEKNFMEAVPKISQEEKGESIIVSFEFTFSDSNLEAAYSLHYFLDAIKQCDKNAWIDISSNIRFLG